MKLKIYRKLLQWFINAGIKLNIIKSLDYECGVRSNFRVTIELDEIKDRVSNDEIFNHPQAIKIQNNIKKALKNIKHLEVKQ